MMDLEALVGTTASFVTVASFVPQVIKVWKSRSAKDLSYGMVGLLLLSGGLWAAYGVLISDTPVIITNVAVAVLNLAILTAKIRYRNG
jgi:MtN3 and saliva related transmembrane protein